MARWGGEEFLVLLHPTDGNAAMPAAQRIRQAITDADLPAALAEVELSASIGVAAVGGRDTEQMLRDADAALYRAEERTQPRRAGAHRLTVPSSSRSPPRRLRRRWDGGGTGPA